MANAASHASRAGASAKRRSPDAAPLVAAVVGRPADARRLQALLRGRPEEALLRLELAASLADARRLIGDTHVDCLLVSAPVVAAAAVTSPDVALVGLGGDDPDAEIEALRAGAQDCVEPGALRAQDLVHSVRFAVERHRLQHDLRRRALHDPLTGLPNRELLLDRLEHALAAMRRQRGSVAAVFLDLDGFKAVNDGVGHHAGDAVLVAAAGRLLAGVRPGDTVARYGGDEFAIVCEDAGRAEVAAVVRRLSRSLARPIRIEERLVRIGASFGTAFADDPTESPEALLRRADAAMYAAKHRRRRRPGSR